MSYSVLVWNVRQYTTESAARTAKVAELIDRFDPDIFGILEFRAKNAARKLVTDFYGEYDFGMTDSKMALEILVGWRRGKFDQVIYTQRREFQANHIDLRPGGLLSVKLPGETAFENLLFLHTDSGKSESDYNNRQTMFGKVLSMKAALEALPIQDSQARLVALGDLNTMGRSKTNTLPTITAAAEIAELESDALNAGMRLLTKSHPKTWSNKSGTKTSNLDHVIASDDLEFRQFQFTDSSTSFEVEVDGWVNLTGNQRKTFLENISDHSALYIEVV